MKSNLLRIYGCLIMKYCKLYKWIIDIKKYYDSTDIQTRALHYDKSTDEYVSNVYLIKSDILKLPYKLNSIEQFEKKIGNRLPEDLRIYLLHISREYTTRCTNLARENYEILNYIKLEYITLPIPVEMIDDDWNTDIKIIILGRIYKNDNCYIIVNKNKFFGKIAIHTDSFDYYDHAYIEVSFKYLRILKYSFTDLINNFCLNNFIENKYKNDRQIAGELKIKRRNFLSNAL